MLCVSSDFLVRKVAPGHFLPVCNMDLVLLNMYIILSSISHTCKCYDQQCRTCELKSQIDQPTKVSKSKWITTTIAPSSAFCQSWNILIKRHPIRSYEFHQIQTWINGRQIQRKNVITYSLKIKQFTCFIFYSYLNICS